MAADCCPRLRRPQALAISRKKSVPTPAKGDWSTIPRGKETRPAPSTRTPIWSMDFRQARSRISIQRFHGLIQQCQRLAIGACLINI